MREGELPSWNAVIGLRTRFLHDYMNIDMARVLDLVQLGRHEFVTAFLLADPVLEEASPVVRLPSFESPQRRPQAKGGPACRGQRSA
ncbi:MAG: hypothetical protein Q8O34_10990 [Rhodocyclaceae bacterium]|nr:hypothetical protein [Rhodocyclaceae bacterium]